jgi:hypothetical protein
MQITTVSIFHFSGFGNRFWALSQMGIAPLSLRNISGLQLCKLMGSGADNGFGIKPNWGVYAMFCIWDKEKDAHRFFEENPVFQAYKDRATHWRTVFCAPTMAHGLWDKKMPFEIQKAFDPAAPVAVLTRATIKRRFMLKFWKQVPGVSHALQDKPGLQYAIGIGELPLIQQATFSMWESGKAMMDFAYRGEDHKKVIAQTRALGWYKEELFARFEVTNVVEGGVPTQT